MAKTIIKEPIVEPVVEILPIKQIKVKKVKKSGIDIPPLVVESVVIKHIVSKPKRVMSVEQKEKMKMGRMKALQIKNASK